MGVRALLVSVVLVLTVAVAACGGGTGTAEVVDDPVAGGDGGSGGEPGPEPGGVDPAGLSDLVDIEALDGPVLVASDDDGSITDLWPRFVESALDLEPVAGPDTVPGFEPFRDGLVLADGRLLVTGRWDGDDTITGWYQRNPDSVGPDAPEPPISESTEHPIRLFALDPGSGSVQPVSHWPEVRPYATAVSKGESPDVPLQLVVVADDVIAYTSGFSGAGYDIPRGLFVAPIPAR